MQGFAATKVFLLSQGRQSSPPKKRLGSARPENGQMTYLLCQCQYPWSFSPVYCFNG